MGRVCARFVLSWIGSFIYFNDEIPILSSLVSMMNNFIQRVSFLSFFFLNWRYSFRRALKWSWICDTFENFSVVEHHWPMSQRRIAWLSRWKFSDKKKRVVFTMYNERDRWTIIRDKIFYHCLCCTTAKDSTLSSLRLNNSMDNWVEIFAL